MTPPPSTYVRLYWAASAVLLLLLSSNSVLAQSNVDSAWKVMPLLAPTTSAKFCLDRSLGCNSTVAFMLGSTAFTIIPNDTFGQPIFMENPVAGIAIVQGNFLSVDGTVTLSLRLVLSGRIDSAARLPAGSTNPEKLLASAAYAPQGLIDASQWHYYTKVAGQLVAINGTDDVLALVDIAPPGQSLPQVGLGANNRDVILGISLKLRVTLAHPVISGRLAGLAGAVPATLVANVEQLQAKPTRKNSTSNGPLSSLFGKQCRLVADCDDGDTCTVDNCVSGQCVSTPLNCEDGDICTTDTCVAGQCRHDRISGCTQQFVFTRLFAFLKGQNSTQTQLQTLGRQGGPMDDFPAEGPSGDATERPAGYTFLGQFIDHDITLDQVSSLTQQNIPERIPNFRTAYLDLDSLYGARGVVNETLFRPDDPAKFRIGNNDNKSRGGPNAHDLPRIAGIPRALGGADGAPAVIGDPRNDENMLVAQVHVCMLAFHNAVVDFLRSGNASQSAAAVRENARQLVRWHYQFMVINDFLPAIVDRAVINDVLQGGRKFYRCNTATPPPMPVEFSVAAYRFGHSIVRPSYTFNGRFTANTFPAVEGSEGFGSTIRGGQNIINDWTVAWARFFDVPAGLNAGRLTGQKPQLGRKIDEKFSHGLMAFLLPGGETLATRNMKRGAKFALPSGQDVAAAMGIPPLSNAQLGIDDIFGDSGAPLYYYILKEADLLNGGQRLGPVGGRIVAEVLIGLIECDPLSFMNASPQGKSFTPTLTVPGTSRRVQSFIDMVAFGNMPLDDL